MTTDPAAEQHATEVDPPRLTVSAALLAVSVVVALTFGGVHNAPNNRSDQSSTPPARHDNHDDPAVNHGNDHTEPRYYAGGLWSPALKLSGLAELAVLSSASNPTIVCQSLAWDPDHERLVVIDTSPLPINSRRGSEEVGTLAVVSIDHQGGDIPVEFAVAVQDHVGNLADAEQIVVFTPLPGPDTRPEDEDPYDWTFLDDGSGKVEIVDWTEVEPLADFNGRPLTGYLHAWLRQQTPDLQGLSSDQAMLLLADLDVIVDRTQAARKLIALAMRSPYEVVSHLHPLQEHDRDRGFAGPSLDDALMLLRAMHVDDDALIDEAAASDLPAFRALAARAMGELHDLTTDPLSKLTPLAEDGDMRVRYEALVACRAMPGRRAAGVARLVEPYAMDEGMRALYTDTLSMMAPYGEPIAADSRADRLRRMPIDELLSQDRDAVACTILLERADLPDNQVDTVLGQLATAADREPLSALIGVLGSLNPRAIDGRRVLLERLAKWDADALSDQVGALRSLLAGTGHPMLRGAVAAAILRAGETPGEGVDPLYFAAAEWVSDSSLRQQITQNAIRTALSDGGATIDTRIAALDTMSQSPTEWPADRVAPLVALARGSADLDLRFAAIRAVNALPASLRPAGIDDLKLTSLLVHTVPGQMKYDVQALTAPAGRPVELTLINPDAMEHNLVVTKPGQAQAVGLMITAMPPSDAAAIGYIPASDAVLFYTPMVRPGGSETLRFIAPDTPGRYGYVCTFPGHYTSMIGVLEVVNP